MDEKRTLGDLTGPYTKRKIYTLTYSSDNRAVLHHDELQQISGPIYRGRDLEDSMGGVSCTVYIYYEDIGYGVAAGSIQAPSTVEVEIYLEGIALERFASPKAYLSWLDESVEKKRFINNAQIALARQIAPEKVPAYERARLDYYAESQRREEERRKAREEQDAAFCREKNDLADEQVAKAVGVIQSGGELENIIITYYRGRYDGMDYSIINHIARQYGVSVPISVQGWINKSLASVTIRDSRAISYYHRAKSKSSTFGGYMNAIVAAVCAAEAPPKKAA